MTSTYENLFDSVRSAIEAYVYSNSDAKGSDPEMDDEVSFWLDPQKVLFETAPDEDDIFAATLEDLKGDTSLVGELISRDIVQTYLSTEDFAVLIGVSEEDDDQDATLVAAIDRTTGIALLKPDNIFDDKALEKAAKAARSNTDSEKLVPVDYRYQFIMPTIHKLTKTQENNSRRRLTSLLTDIDSFVLQQHVGHEIQFRDDL